MKQNYNTIDITKFIMAIFVMTVHIDTGLSAHRYISDTVARIAVPFFFISSGFFFFYNKEELSIYELFKRLKRIGLLFIGWTLFYGIAFYFIRDHSKDITKLFKFLFRHIFLNPYAHLWFLPALMIGITLTWLFHKYKKIGIGFLLALILYILGTLEDSYYFLSIQNYYLKTIYETYHLFSETTRNGIFFGFLMVYISILPKIKYQDSLKILFFSTILLILESCLIEYNGWANDNNMYFSLIAFAPSFFHVILNSRINITQKQALFFREYSMGIYFLHPFVNMLNLYTGEGRFLFIFLVCILIIFLVKKFRIPFLSFLLK